MEKLETFDSIYLWGKNNFEVDGTQNWLVFQPVRRYIKTVSANNSNVLSWKSKGLSDESVKPLSTSKKMLYPSVYYAGKKAKVKVNLKQEKLHLIMEK